MPRKEITGEVVSNKMEKTVVVAVELRVPHRRLEKQRKVTRKFKAHDENNKCQIGDIVRIRETRPLSRDKRWVVFDISGHAIADIDITDPEAVTAAKVKGESVIKASGAAAKDDSAAESSEGES
jgi:small subunit ribosomal protein S17